MGKAYLIFEDKTVFEGKSLGSPGQVTGAVKPYNGMTGYQEFLTQPSCFGDIICMTYPIIGNVGTSENFSSSSKIQSKGIIVRESNPDPSSSSSETSFENWLSANGCVGICDVDTRSIVRHLKTKEKMNAVITTVENPDISELAKTAALYMIENPISKVSVKEETIYFNEQKHTKTICVIDLGISDIEIAALNLRGAKLVVLPYDTNPEKIMSLKPDGIYISNGPEVSRFELIPVYESINVLKSKYPVLACGNGHLALAQSFGLIPENLPTGHHGVNYPVIDLKSKSSYITSQNHQLAFFESDIYSKYNIEVSHKNINDNSIEGFIYSEKVKSVQFVPDIKTAEFNTGYIWDDFISQL